MKRMLTLLTLACVVAIAANAMADKSSDKPMKMKMSMEKTMEKAKTMTMQGEIVDLGCYLGHGARGEKHKSCATKCIMGGMPMGLLTDGGKLYLLTLDHQNADPYNQAKEMAAEMVKVTGTVMERNGMMAIDVTGVKPVSVAAASEKK